MQWTVRLEARTSAGEVTTTELVTFSRPVVVSTLAEIGLVLSETKALLAKLQASMLCGQVAEYAAHRRACVECGALQPLKDRRTRRLQTLFGTVEVEAPWFKVCRCRLTTPMTGVTVSPVCALLTTRCTPELERVQAELGARTSFRDGLRILEALLPVSPANHESLRIRTHAVALRLEAADRQAAAEITAVRDDPAKAAAADASRPVVMLDGAYIRAVPGHQVRNFEAVCGKVEREGHPTRRFALVRSVAEQPHGLLRAVLQDQGWREGDAVTAISDGDPALPALVRSATGGRVSLSSTGFVQPEGWRGSHRPANPQGSMMECPVREPCPPKCCYPDMRRSNPTYEAPGTTALIWEHRSGGGPAEDGRLNASERLWLRTIPFI